MKRRTSLLFPSAGSHGKCSPEDSAGLSNSAPEARLLMEAVGRDEGRLGFQMQSRTASRGRQLWGGPGGTTPGVTGPPGLPGGGQRLSPSYQTILQDRPRQKSESDGPKTPVIAWPHSGRHTPSLSCGAMPKRTSALSRPNPTEGNLDLLKMQ